jgi:hypothetical protein
MDIRTLLALFLIPALLLACSDNAPDTADTTPAPSGGSEQTQGDVPDSFSITYSGGFAGPNSGSTVTTIQDGRVSVTSMGADGSVNRIQERELTEEQQEEFEDLMDDIDELEPSYGSELRGTVADAGIAEVVINRDGEQMMTVVDPNVPEAFPESLYNVVDWLNELLAVQDTSSISCSDPRPENCAQVQDPVCGDDGQTYSNGCMACADEDVASYVAGEC